MIYEANNLGRGGQNKFNVVMTGFIAVVFLIATMINKSVLFGIFSIVLLFFTGSAIRAYMKKENWLSGIDDDIYSWKSHRWPASKGSIDLKKVSKVMINESSPKIFFHNEHDNKTVEAYHFGIAGNLNTVHF